MDVAFTLARLADDVAALISDGDWSGAEHVLEAALADARFPTGLVHFELARLYFSWNKLTSSSHHLLHALDCAVASADQSLQFLVLTELKKVQNLQRSQDPSLSS